MPVRRLALWLTMCYQLVNKYTTYTLLLLTDSPGRYMNVMQIESCGTDMKLFICIFWILWTISEVLDFRHKKYAISAKIDGIFLFVCSVQVPGVGRKSCQCKLGNSYIVGSAPIMIVDDSEKVSYAIIYYKLVYCPTLRNIHIFKANIKEHSIWGSLLLVNWL